FRGQLLVAGRIKDGVVLDKPIKDALILTKPPRPITLRDLLTHTSGLPGDFPAGLADIYTKRNRTLAEVVPAVSQRPLNFEPGSRGAYWKAGSDVLGRIIEVAARMSYEDFLKKRIFDPLSRSNTMLYPTQNQMGRAAPTVRFRVG